MSRRKLPFWVEVKPCKEGILNHKKAMARVKEQAAVWEKSLFYKSKQTLVMLVETGWSPVSYNMPVFLIVPPENLHEFLADGTSGSLCAVTYLKEMGVYVDYGAVCELEAEVRFHRRSAAEWNAFRQKNYDVKWP